MDTDRPKTEFENRVDKATALMAKVVVWVALVCAMVYMVRCTAGV